MPALPRSASPRVDALGVEHRPAPAARIVSLVPSITELLFDLGLGAQLVGRTGFCVHPRPQVDEVPKLGGTKDVHLDKLRALQPSHVIVNIDENEATLVEALRDCVPNIVVTHPLRPEDNLGLYRLLGDIFERGAAAEQLCEQLSAELSACRAVDWPSEHVLYLVWREPWMTVARDTYIAGMLALVGWEVLHPAGGFAGAARYPQVELQREVPRVGRVLLSTEPFLFNQSHRAELRGRFPATPVDLIDAEMTSWYGSRAIRGVRYLRELRRSLLTGARARARR